MTDSILSLLGGIGLFLIGIQTMTEGLRRTAGPAIRSAIGRFTRTPLHGVVTGTLATAAIQSSSAITVITIGFVGAGLLTFPQAVGVVFGANVGTTVTGWMVVLVGFKLKLGTVALPILFAGALMRLIGRGRTAEAGGVLAGFAMLFLGLDIMQSGLTGLEGRLRPEDLPPDTPLGRAALVIMGLGASLLIRSSSAGVAAVLVLLGAGTVDFGQAAAIVIGMDIGTTFTGLLATIGGSRAMRQTGVAHLLYNLVTAMMAFAVIGWVGPWLLEVFGGDAQAALVAFHTGFNVAGVLVLLPFVQGFARLVQRLVPEREAALAEALDPALLAEPGAALDAAATCAGAIAGALFAGLAAALRPGGTLAPLSAAVAVTEGPLARLETYLGQIVVPPQEDAALARYAALLHAVDHLNRLRARCAQEARVLSIVGQPRLLRFARVFGAILERAGRGEPAARLQARLARLGRLVSAREARLRRELASGPELRGLAPAQLFALTDGIRWLARAAGHAERILHYGLAARGAPSGARRG